MPNSYELLLERIETIIRNNKYEQADDAETTKLIVDEIEKQICDLQIIHKGSYAFEKPDQYSIGLFNGMEIIRSVLTGTEPRYEHKI